MARTKVSARRSGTPVILGVVASVAVATIPGSASWAAIPPDALAFITAPEIALGPPTTTWLRGATIRQTGDVAGHPGNRHTVTVEIGTEGDGLSGSVTIQDDVCDASGTCEPVAAGVAQVPDGTPVPALGADGSVHLTVAIPGSAVTSTLPDGPTEFADADVDLTITPTGWQPRPALTRENAEAVNHLVTTDRNTLRLSREATGEAVTASGTAAGVRAGEVLGGSWRDTDVALGTGTALLSRPLGPIGLAPYAPAVRSGAVVDESWWVPTWVGFIAAGSPLVTSTGYRLPGNAYEVNVFGRVNLLPGESLSGTGQPRRTAARLSMFALQCEAGQSPQTCPRVPMPTVIQEAPVQYRVWQNGRVRLSTEVRLRTTEEQPQDLGSLNLRLDALPSGVGNPSRNGTLDRETGWWGIDTRVRYLEMIGSVTLGGRQVEGVWFEHLVRTWPGGTL
jgi:hypothetical protein